MEEVKEAKTDVVEENLDVKMDKILDELEGKETPPESSTETKPKGEETKTEETPSAEEDKTDKVKQVEEDSSLSVEDKIAKIKEVLGDDEKAVDAYVKEKGFHNDPAWQKQRELIDKLKKQNEEGTTSKEELEKVTSSREYIESSMKTQGFTQEAIDTKLREKGFEVKEPTEAKSELEFIANALKVDPKTLQGELSKNMTRQDYIEDVAKVARIIAADEISKIVPNSLKPIQDFINTTSKKESGSVVVDTMEKQVKEEGVLDWAKDVEPEMTKYLDTNPKATQNDILLHFKEFTRKANIERLKVGQRKGERDVKKANLRQNAGGAQGDETLPAKTNKFHTDADAILDYLGVN